MFATKRNGFAEKNHEITEDRMQGANCCCASQVGFKKLVRGLAQSGKLCKVRGPHKEKYKSWKVANLKKQLGELNDGN